MTGCFHTTWARAHSMQAARRRCARKCFWCVKTSLDLHQLKPKHTKLHSIPCHKPTSQDFVHAGLFPLFSMPSAERSSSGLSTWNAPWDQGRIQSWTLKGHLTNLIDLLCRKFLDTIVCYRKHYPVGGHGPQSPLDLPWP